VLRARVPAANRGHQGRGLEAPNLALKAGDDEHITAADNSEYETQGGVGMTRRLIIAGTAAACTALVLPLLAFGRPDATTVAVTAGKPNELRFTVSKRTVPAGAVTFAVTNRGKLKHDFKISGKKTRLLAAGKKGTLQVTLKAGRYPFLCTVPGHAAGGMKGTLTVTS
jgi:uncharacterized cupredoxin-like copper-binding protein